MLCRLLLLIFLSTPALACPAPKSPSGAAAQITQPPDTALVSAAILAEVNRLRCARGLPALADRPGLASVAEGHSRWQALSGRLSHVSTLRDLETLKKRLRVARERSGWGAENVGALTACAPSYIALAQRMVALWQGSPAHLANMLHARMTRAGAGIALANDCLVYATLELAG